MSRGRKNYQTRFTDITNYSHSIHQLRVELLIASPPKQTWVSCCGKEIPKDLPTD